MRRRSHGERNPPVCAFSLAQLVAKRREALLSCDEMGWKPSRLYDALEVMSKGDSGGVLGSFWQPVPRPAHAVPVELFADAAFLRAVLRAEREAKALNAGKRAGFFGEDAEGVGLSLSAELRRVEAIEARHAATRPREGSAKSKGR